MHVVPTYERPAFHFSARKGRRPSCPSGNFPLSLFCTCDPRWASSLLHLWGETEKGTSPAASLPSLRPPFAPLKRENLEPLARSHTHASFNLALLDLCVRGKEIRRASLQSFFLMECKRIAQHLHKLSHFPSFLATRPEWVHFLHLYRDSPPLFTLLRGPLRPQGLAASPPPPSLAFIHPRTQRYRLYYSETRAQKVF